MKKICLLISAIVCSSVLCAQVASLEIGLTNVASEPDVDGIGLGVHYGHNLSKWLEIGAGITISNAYDVRKRQRFLQEYVTGRMFVSLIPLRIGDKYYLRLGGAYNFTSEKKVWLITNSEGEEILEEAVNQWDWLGGSVHAGLGWIISDKWSLEARSNLGGYSEARLIGDWGIFLHKATPNSIDVGN